MRMRIRRTARQIEAKNKLDSLIYNTEKILKENREKISDADATSLDAALSNAKKVLESSSEASELNAAVEELTKASHHLAEIMYQKTAGQQPPHGGPGADPDSPAPAQSRIPGKRKMK